MKFTFSCSESPARRLTSKESGITLAVVVITGLILTVGAMTLAGRSLSNLANSTRQQQRREAREIAENGVSLILKELNDNFSYLLTESCNVVNNSVTEQLDQPECTGWIDSSRTITIKDGDEEKEAPGTHQIRGSLCPGSVTPSNKIMDEIYKETPSGKGKYRLMDYSFAGDQYQGGWATIKVQGQRLIKRSGKDRIAASAIIEQEVTIAPKYCDLPPFQELTSPPSSSSGYGLLAGKVKLKKGSSVLDQEPNADEPSQANVNCNTCNSPPDPDVKSSLWNGVQTGNSVIDGARSSDPEPRPTDFMPPEWNDAWGKTPWVLTNNWQTITIGHNTHPSYCHTENSNPPITHCLMDNITISGGKVTIDPGKGEIRFYLRGQAVSINTDNFVTTGGNFGQVAFFGQTKKTWGNLPAPQQFALSGEDNFGPVFLQMPHTYIPINGRINIIGAAIVDNWNANGNSNLIVPKDASKIMNEKYNISYTNSAPVTAIREFTAVGVNRWNLIQLER